MGRFIAFLYELISYAVFFVTFLSAIGFVSNLVVRKTIDDGTSASTSSGLVINIVLMSLFAIQHSVMACGPFKESWTQYVPNPIVRSTYVLFARLALILLFGQWRPLPNMVWHIENPQIATAVTGLSFIGWLLVLTSTFLINHFELFELHQVANSLTGQPMPAPRFRTPFYYKFVQHPIYLGFIIALSSAAPMTIGHLLCAAVATAYIVVGALLEQRGLADLLGGEYRCYQGRVSMLVPWRRSARECDGATLVPVRREK